MLLAIEFQLRSPYRDLVGGLQIPDPSVVNIIALTLHRRPQRSEGDSARAIAEEYQRQ